MTNHRRIRGLGTQRESKAAHEHRTWDAWRDYHQPFELDWWRTALAGGHSASPGFEEHWRPVIAWIKPEPLIIDIGCGARPPFLPCIAIEPLAFDYWELRAVDGKPVTNWWTNVEAFSRPAEERIEELAGVADTVICWNCLDHTIGWRDILDNMLFYGTPGARFAISTDFHAPFLGHPGFERDDFDHEIGKRFEIIESRAEHSPKGAFRAVSLLMRRK